MSSAEADKAGYWEGYYATGDRRLDPPPSQFAAFIAQEIEGQAKLIDIGCGAGRDSIFFAQRGFQVLGIDESPAAIESCREVMKQQSSDEGTQFECASVGTSEFAAVLAQAVADAAQPVVAYARFFLHAITDDEQDSLLSVLSSALCTGDLLAVEYRTTRDADLTKATSSHFRRFVDPARLIVTIAGLGFTIQYATEGFGYAKYRADDAYVARAVFRKS